MHDFGNSSISAHPYNITPSILQSQLSGSSWTNSTSAWTSYAGSSGEAIALGVSRALAPLIPDNYKSIDAGDVARALLDAVPKRLGRIVLMSAGMRS